MDVNVSYGHSVYTLLDIACYEGDLETAEILVREGAILDQERDVPCPLDAALIAGNIEVIHYLIDHDVPFDYINNEGDNSLMQAIRWGERDSALAQLTGKSNKQEPSLERSAKRMQLAELCVHHGANINHVSDTGMSALSCAISLKEIEIIKLLFKHGLDIELVNPDYCHQLALESQVQEIISIIERAKKKRGALKAEEERPLKRFKEDQGSED
jgi:ankyrin repeat protein